MRYLCCSTELSYSEFASSGTELSGILTIFYTFLSSGLDNLPQTLNITVKLTRLCAVDFGYCCRTLEIPIVVAVYNHGLALGRLDATVHCRYMKSCIVHWSVHSCHCRQIYKDLQCQTRLRCWCTYYYLVSVSLLVEFCYEQYLVHWFLCE